MKHFRLYIIALFIACSMFVLCPFAHAEGMDESSRQAVFDALGSSRVQTYGTYLTSVLDECPYFYIMENTGYSTGFAAYFTTNPIVGGCFYPATGSSSYVCMNKTTYDSVPGGTVYVWYESGNWTTCYKYVYTATPAQNTFIGGKSATRSTHYDVRGSFSEMSVQPALNSYVANFSGVVGYRSNGSIGYTFEQNFTPISYSDDERLKFALVDNIYGGKNLMTDIRQFINDFPIQDTSHSSVLLYPETISLTYSVDNVEKTITLDSSNSTIKSKYIFETDISNFDFDDTSQNVIITKCDFTISGNTQSGQTETQNFYINCDYYIKRYIQPIVPGSNPYKSDVDGDQTSQETKASLEYLVTFREGYGLDFDEFSDLSFPDYYTYADVYLYNNSAAYNYIIDNILSVNAVAYIIQNLANSEDDVIKQIGLFLDDSNYGEYYDVIVFDWIQETSSSYTHTYFYFETVSGRVKASTQFLQIMQDDLNKVKINTAAAFTAIDNFENESIQFFNAKLSLDEDILGWIKTLDNSINNIDFPTYDDSNLLSMLGQIKDLLSSPANEIDTPQECIQLYEAHPNYFDELWGTSPSLRSASRASNPFSGSEYVRADLVPAWWEGKTLTMIYLIKNDGSTSRFYNDMLNGLYTAYDNLISSNNAFNDYINSLFKYNYDYSGSFYGHLFSLDYNPEEWSGGFNE